MNPFELYKKLKALIYSSHAHFIEKAEILYKLYDKGLYKKAVGEESWGAFLADPDISISRSDFLKSIKGRDIVNCKHEHVKEIPTKTVCEDCGEKL